MTQIPINKTPLWMLVGALALGASLAKLAGAEALAPSETAAPKSVNAFSALEVDPARYATRLFDWQDPARARAVPARLYLPAGDLALRALPLVVFSHGIGGSREGYSYLGRHLAAHGYASLHVQHVGSDRQLWWGNPFGLVSRLSNAAREAEAIDRVRDLSFALDQLLQSELATRINHERIVAAGHSYGANTTMLIAGAAAESQGQTVSLRDARIKAAVLISAPPFYGTADFQKILSPISIPTLHITATADDIQIPGYRSGLADRIDVYQATGAGAQAKKALAIFKDGSHSIFTDRMGTGGVALNPLVKAATRKLVVAFLDDLDRGDAQGIATWERENHALVSRFEQSLAR